MTKLTPESKNDLETKRAAPLATPTDRKGKATRAAHDVRDEHHDIATASLVENWSDEAERRTRCLFESGPRQDATGH